MRTVLTIAGSDCSGGAGIQADIKTIMANGAYAMSAITALTAQNTLGVKSIQNSTAEFMADQLDCIFEDIRPDAVKIGMLSEENLIKVIAEKLSFYHAENIVVDPVMVSTSGSKLISETAINAMKEMIFPLSAVITPNIPEAIVLTHKEIQNEDDMLECAAIISNEFSTAVLLKGGHSINDANDLLYLNGRSKWFKGKRIDNPNTHGTGCTLSSAIATNLAKGHSIEQSVELAKEYISDALAAMLNLGRGSGPLNHGFAIDNKYMK